MRTSSNETKQNKKNIKKWYDKRTLDDLLRLVFQDSLPWSNSPVGHSSTDSCVRYARSSRNKRVVFEVPVQVDVASQPAVDKGSDRPEWFHRYVGNRSMAVEDRMFVLVY